MPQWAPYVRSDSIAGRAVFIVTLVLILPGSKFLVLWLTKLVFGSSVMLGGFLAVTGLVVTLMAARGLVRWGLERLAR